MALRKALSAVRYGSYREYRPLSGKHYIYSREDEGQRLLIVCSFARRETAFRAPRGFDLASGRLILQNYAQIQEGTLQPYEARVYLWDKV